MLMVAQNVRVVFNHQSLQLTSGLERVDVINGETTRSEEETTCTP